MGGHSRGPELRLAAGDGCMAVQVYLTPLNLTLRNGESGGFYVMYLSPQFVKR